MRIQADTQRLYLRSVNQVSIKIKDEEMLLNKLLKY